MPEQTLHGWISEVEVEVTAPEVLTWCLRLPFKLDA